jgi:hypothetical protein
VVGLSDVAGLSVVLGLVGGGAGVDVVVVVREAVVIGGLVVVVSGPEVAVAAGDVVVGTDLVGGGAWAGPDPSALLVVPVGGGRT